MGELRWVFCFSHMQSDCQTVGVECLHARPCIYVEDYRSRLQSGECIANRLNLKYGHKYKRPWTFCVHPHPPFLHPAPGPESPLCEVSVRLWYPWQPSSHSSWDCRIPLCHYRYFIALLQMINIFLGAACSALLHGGVAVLPLGSL